MARTSHIVTPGINNPGSPAVLRACRAWRIAPLRAADAAPFGILGGVFPVTVQLAAPDGALYSTRITIDNDGWQTLATGPDWFIASVSRVAVEERNGVMVGQEEPNNKGVGYLVEAVDDVRECGQVNTRQDDPPPVAVEFKKLRINGPVTLAALSTLAACLGPTWATRLAIVLKGTATVPPAFRLEGDVTLVGSDFDTAAPASLPAVILMGYPSAAAPTGQVLAGSTPLPPNRYVRLVNVGAWTLAGGQYVDVFFRWSR